MNEKIKEAIPVWPHDGARQGVEGISDFVSRATFTAWDGLQAVLNDEMRRLDRRLFMFDGVVAVMVMDIGKLNLGRRMSEMDSVVTIVIVAVG